MNRILICLIAFAISLSFEACEHSTEPVEKPLDEGHRNFPLHVGDTWKYEFIEAAHRPELLGQTLTLQIVDKQEINGQTYFLFDSDFSQQLCPLDSGLFRVEENKVYRLWEGEEYLWYDFDAKPGPPFSPEADNWEVPSTVLGPGHTTFVQTRFIGDCSELGTARNVIGDSCYVFYFFDGTDAARSESYAPGIGFVSNFIASFGFTKYAIQEAIVNGVMHKF